MNQFRGSIQSLMYFKTGASHDSTIFTNSNLCQRLRNNEFGLSSVVVADAAYPPESFICKPLPVVVTENEENYQRAQLKARNVVERVIGQLKRQFPILQHGNIHIE